MPAKLLYRDGQGRDQTVDIPEGAPIFVGRGTDCAVRTDDPMVSRKNYKLTYQGGQAVVEDLGSSNGTYVNGTRVQRQGVAHGDVIGCGKEGVSLQVRFVDAAGGAAASQQGQPQRPSATGPSSVIVAPQPQPGGGARPTGPTTPPMGMQAVQVSAADLARTNEALAAQQQQINDLSLEREQLQKQLRDAQSELETMRPRLETTEKELQRLRTDAVNARDELAKTRRDAVQDKEELTAISRTAEEMRQELKAAKEALLTLKTKTDEQGEELAAKDRQLERAQEDLHRTKQATEELRAKLGELQKTKDEGWRELNSQLSQVEHLREVISEQERILEERRVGLIALESAAKDLRAEKEKSLRELVDTRGQRDELKEKLARAQATIDGLEEEHRRLARVAGGGGGASGEEMQRMSAELRELKVAQKKLESERDRNAEELERVTADREKLMDEKSRLEVERSQLVDDKQAAEAARARADELRAKAEVLREQIDEERQKAAKARDAALTSVDETRRELDRVKRRLAEFEKATGGAPPPASNADAEAQKRTAAAEQRAAQLEAETKRLTGELQKALALGGGGGNGVAAAAAGGSDGAELKQRAREVYDEINGILSELRTTILTAKDLFGEISPAVKDEAAKKGLKEAIASSMDRTEDAKGMLRSLKQLAQD